MSDKLSDLMRQAADLAPAKSEDPDQRLIDALGKALEATTPEYAGCPWDETTEGDREQARDTGVWLPEAGD